MSSLYLIRHGQAGSRAHYDTLSDLGREQARRLGEAFRGLGVRFTAAYAGTMRRQQETAALVLAALDGAPECVVDPRWNEFALDDLWARLAPRLMATDPKFAADYERHHARHPNVDRAMTTCDVQLIRAWVAGAPCDGMETWEEFSKRVGAPRAELAERHGPGEAVAVFTSATPTSIWCGAALDLDPQRTFRVAAVLCNASYTTFRLRAGEVTLFSLNNTHHLSEARLRTFR